MPSPRSSRFKGLARTVASDSPRLRGLAEALQRARPWAPASAARTSAPSGEVALPAELTEAGSRRTLPLPEGVTARELRDLLATVSIEAARPEELRGYLDEDFERFVHTWGLTRGATGRCLEIGANPYFTTVLLRELSDLDLTLTNYFGPSDSPTTQRVTYRGLHDATPTTPELTYHVLNVEHDPFPFEDASFDLVLFCEVIEHLLTDPVAALLEVKRVLRPGGRLVLTTPNVARLENVARLVAGVNLYDPYSGYGAYGRHNREYTRHEIHHLLTWLGLDVIDHFTADVHPHATSAFAEPARVAAALEQRRLPDLGQYLFFDAENARPASGGRPSWLYRSREDVTTA